MGSECPKEEREIRYRTFYDSIYVIENEIKAEMNNHDITKKKYSPFGLINQGLCKKYPFLLDEKFNSNAAKNKIFNYNDLIEETDKKDFSYIYHEFAFDFPSNFIFIHLDFMKIIREYVGKYKKYLKTNYDTIIGGGCLIMKNSGSKKDINPFRYIIIYHEIKEKIGNKIDFFLFIKDKEKRTAAVNYILEFNIWNYFKKINYNYKNEYKKIYENKKEIGYIVRNSEISRFESFVQKINKKTELIPPNISVETNLINKPIQSIMPTIPVKMNSFEVLDSIILSFFQFEKLKQSLTENRNLDYNTFKMIITVKVGQKLNSLKNIEEIFKEILTKLDDNSKINKEFYNQTSQYDEQKGLKNFMELHNKGNIIQKLFLIPKQETIICKHCNFKTYKFIYEQFILIKNPLNELLFQKIFNTELMHQKGKFCSYCSGRITEYSIESKIICFPEILIILIEPNQVINFSLESNLHITNGQNILYILKLFIEADSNLLYLVNNNSCQKLDANNNLGNYENIKGKKSIVLFYQLMLINPPTNSNSIQLQNNSSQGQNFQFQNNSNINNNIPIDNNLNNFQQNNCNMQNNNYNNPQNINNNIQNNNMNNNNYQNTNIQNIQNINMNNNNYQNNNNYPNNNIQDINMNNNNMQNNNMNNNFYQNNNIQNNIINNNNYQQSQQNNNNFHNNNINFQNNFNNNNQNNNFTNNNMNNLNNMNMNNNNCMPMNMNININMDMNNNNINNGNNINNNQPQNNFNQNNNMMNFMNVNNFNSNNNNNNVNFNNANQMNFNNINNNNIIQNNQQMNMFNNSNNNGGIQGEEENPNLIFITFTFKKGKQIYIDVDKNAKFSDVLVQLMEKYEWLNDIGKISYFFNKIQIKDFNKTLNELGIDDNSDILILTES